MNTIKIDVTQEDIDNGVRLSPRLCPIARAARRTFPSHATEIEVDGYSIEMCSDYDLVELPDEAKAFVNAFDATQPVKPFSFTIEVPDYSCYEELT